MTDLVQRMTDVLAQVNQRLAQGPAAPEYVPPTHEEINLATVNHEDLGLDPYDYDDPLVKAIYKKQIEAEARAAHPGLIPSVKAAIDRGFHVFALTPKDKVTLPGSHGFKDSRSPSDPLVLAPWNEEPNRNIGINLGASDLCVLDFDKPESIPAWLNETKTYKVKTGKGVHVYFRGARKTTKLYVDGNLVGDVKSQGGYVLAAGSIHPSGAVYAVVDDSEILPTPDRVSELLKQEEKAPVNVSPDGPPIPHGSHDTELTRIAGLLRNASMNVQDIEEHLIQVCERRCENYGSDYREMCKKIAKSIGKKPVGQAPPPVIVNGQVAGQQTQSVAQQSEIPIVDDPLDEDPRFEMKGNHFDTKVYEDISERFTEYPNPGNGDWISVTANKLVYGTSIPLAFVREPLKAIVLHALDGKLIHPANPKLSLRGNYFSLAESEGGKTTGLEFAIQAAEIIGKTAGIHFENLFRYKSETTFIRSFTPEGTIKRERDGAIKSGEPGHPSQFLYIKEGNLVANASDYFAAVLAMLTNLYDQTEAGTESMTNGNFTARSVRASTVMCFTPSDFKATFGGKGTIGGGILNRWAVVNPPPITEYDSKDWEQLSGEEIQQAVGQLTAVVFNLRVGEPIVLTEEPGAAKIRLEAKTMLKKAGKIGKRLMDYFMREQVAQAATAVDGRLVMTTEQAQYGKRWVEAQMECRLNHWPSDANNQIETMEHAIRKAVSAHHVPETKLKDVCHLYREGSGGWYVYSSALKNMVASGVIKATGRTRKGARTYCPGSCMVHPPVQG